MPNKKSWNDKLAASKPSKQVRLEKNFAGIQAGQMMLVASPRMVADYMQAIPFGETRDIIQLRNELAAENQCDASCPVSTSIFIRIAAEAAIEDIHVGNAPEDVIPFWRVVEPGSKMAEKLAIDSQWIEQQRASEKT